MTTNPDLSANSQADDVVGGHWPKVHRTLPTPLYHQVYSALRDLILDGSYHPGDVFPSEQKVTKIFGVSRITARRALEELSMRGFVSRQQGRPTRVSPYQPEVSLKASVEGLVENNRRMAAETEVAVLDLAYIPASEEIAKALHLRRGELVQWAVRVRSFQGVRFSYMVTHLPEDVGRTFGSQEMSSLPLLLLLERCGVSVASAEQTISAISATPPVARALRIEPGAALLHVVRTVFDQNARPVEHIAVQYRPDVYHYSVSLERTKTPEGRLWATRN